MSFNPWSGEKVCPTELRGQLVAAAFVETPAQAKVLTDALGDGWRVEPCYGLARDLVDGELGIDPAGDFRPTFAVTADKGELMRRLMRAVQECEAICAATPPGREGELMAWRRRRCI